ncbi:TM2 domain-containing protein [Paenibacillus sacheonensis]|uniref:NINE protein n=1 Tax=Paenibacillus sacheonensis TaxID=742054 RepID=A0A7X5C1P4_9BACL|nr:TM2 domain-containing protein [Paenibacillus sacheonensis]MBM7569128.1 TM2 domain-containing membrane protein YozV [Paenibacillus sacheonensis]NBC72962.1 NINE protein [Paenibacillus sacheonensis]
MNYNIAQKSQLDTRELLLLDQEVRSQGKSMLVAYILWFFLGGFGAHRFYVKRTGTAIVMLILTLTIVGAVVTGIWALIDAFLLHGIVKEENDKLEGRILNDLLSQKHFNNAMSR